MHSSISSPEGGGAENPSDPLEGDTTRDFISITQVSDRAIRYIVCQPAGSDETTQIVCSTKLDSTCQYSWIERAETGSSLTYDYGATVYCNS